MMTDALWHFMEANGRYPDHVIVYRIQKNKASYLDAETRQ